MEIHKVPFDLTDPTSNIPCISKIIKMHLDIEDPIILDAKFKEVKDTASTRGSLFANHI